MFSVAGRDGLLPSVSAFLHMNRMTPVIPCIVEGFLGKNHLHFQMNHTFLRLTNYSYYFLGIIFLLIGDAERLLGYLSFSTWLVCVCASVSVLIFRRTMPNVPRPFNAGVIAPILFAVPMTILTLINIFYNPYDILVGMLILLSGLPIYWIFVLNRPASLDKFSKSITIYLQKLFLIVPDNYKQEN